jgi:hypothetical protein
MEKGFNIRRAIFISHALPTHVSNALIYIATQTWREIQTCLFRTQNFDELMK